MAFHLLTNPGKGGFHDTDTQKYNLKKNITLNLVKFISASLPHFSKYASDQADIFSFKKKKA